MTGTAEIIHGNALALPLDNESVDLIVTSPPYFDLRLYEDDGKPYHGQIGNELSPEEYLTALWTSMAHWWDKLKPMGSVWVNVGDKYGKNKSLMGMPWRFAIGCIDGKATLDHQRWILRAEVVWSKPNGLPESVNDRVRRNHEQWFHFVKQPKYFSAMDEVREPHTHPAADKGNVRYTNSKNGGTVENRAKGMGNDSGSFMAFNPLGKLPNSVWSIPIEPLKAPTHRVVVDELPVAYAATSQEALVLATQHQGEIEPMVNHFAAFPTAWPIKIIKGWSPPDGVVLDPFGGTGTVALAAKVLGRKGISVDLSRDYCHLAEWRTNDENQISKVRKKAGLKAPSVPKAESTPSSEKQLSFLEE